MNRFNVLSTEQNIHKNYLLEASAGTGKTFSIENIVVRLLIENKPNTLEPISIEQILVVTFTREATRDLTLRIRSNIERTINYFEHAESSKPSKNIPEYILAQINLGSESIRVAKKRLEQALFCFDQAQIFTIHGFCTRMLRDNLFEGNIGGGSLNEVDPISDAPLYQIVRDFFRTRLTPSEYHQTQLKIILKEYNNSTEELERQIVNYLKKGLDVVAADGFSQELSKFQKAVLRLQSLKLDPEKILADFILQAPSYKDLCNIKRQLKPEYIQTVKAFADLLAGTQCDENDFAHLISEGLFLCDALDESQLKANASPKPSSDLHYPDLIKILRTELQPIVERSRSPLVIFSRILKGCQAMVRQYLAEEEKLGFDDLLKAMQKAIHQSSFADRIRKRFQAAIVDEFQDTDPIQWQIFQELFLCPDFNLETAVQGNKVMQGFNSESFEIVGDHSQLVKAPTTTSDYGLKDCVNLSPSTAVSRFKGYLYLVGDPKQSIYAFRQADIYTYLDAAQAIGTTNHASLNTNYRSQPTLIDALNALFSSVPDFISLPRINKTLDYQNVSSCSNISEKPFEDGKGSLHFFLAKAQESQKNLPLEELESLYYFPFIASEIQTLHTKGIVKYNQCAILVSDRYQSQRIAEYLRSYNIPAMVQRCTSLAHSQAVASLRELLQAVLNPRNDNSLKIALGGRIIGWDHHKVRALSASGKLETTIASFIQLRKELTQSGFASFFHKLLESHWDNSLTVSEKLLSQKNGLDFLQDLEQISHILMEEEYEKNASPASLMAFMDQFDVLDNNDDPRIKRLQDPCQDAVPILTLHTSKGLEFDVVFPLGLIKRIKANDLLLPIKLDGQPQPILHVVENKKSAIFQQHCAELDSEKMRQLYVALTRAKYRVYVPVAILPEAKPIEFGCASPMDLFLAKLNQPSVDIHQLYDRINQFNLETAVQGNKVMQDFKSESFETVGDHSQMVKASTITNDSGLKDCVNLSPSTAVSRFNGHALFDFIESQRSQSISYEWLNLETAVQEAKVMQDFDNVTLLPPQDIIIPGNDQFISSFTTLSKSFYSHIPTSNLETPHDYFAKEKSVHNLPSGSDTGILLHKILETISFHEAKEASLEQILPFTEKHVNNTAFQDWKYVLNEIVYNALTIPLTTFRLCDVDPGLFFKETEFLYPNHTKGLIKGVIDLFFMHEGKYYLLDWKSNWLGPSFQDYSQEKLIEAMHAHDYFLQTNIYCEALKRYLNLFDKRPFESIFGGVFYVFLRGIDPKQSQSFGIYHFMPSL